MQNLITNGANIALAVSGGADSLCMTLLFKQLNLFQLTPLIVDHKLRNESTDEAHSVKEYLKEKLNLEATILTWDRDHSVSSNIQSKARKSRYRLLTDHCKRHNIEYLCIAHNKNDQAETILMNIMRGSGIDGIVGIRKKSTVSGLKLIRPILCFSRNEIEDYLIQHNLDWVHDPSNNNMKYERVKVRKLIQNIEQSDLINAEHLISRLNLLSENALRAHDFISDYTWKKIKDSCAFHPLDVVSIDVERIIGEKEEIILRVLVYVIKKCGGKEYVVRQNSLMKLCKLLLSNHRNSKPFDLTLGGCIIWYTKGILVFKREKCHKDSKLIAKNDIRKILIFLQGDSSKYMIEDHRLHDRLSMMVQGVPKAYKAFYGEVYEERQIYGKIRRIFPSLGIVEN